MRSNIDFKTSKPFSNLDYIAISWFAFTGKSNFYIQCNQAANDQRGRYKQTRYSRFEEFCISGLLAPVIYSKKVFVRRINQGQMNYFNYLKENIETWMRDNTYDENMRNLMLTLVPSVLLLRKNRKKRLVLFQSSKICL